MENFLQIFLVAFLLTHIVQVFVTKHQYVELDPYILKNTEDYGW